MKPLRFPSTVEQASDLRGKREKCLQVAVQNANENWMADILATTGRKWTRQAMWGYRIFDFWCAELGIAVEVDGKSHDIRYDNYRDEYNYRRSGIIVLRVRNGCQDDAAAAVHVIRGAETWKERRAALGIAGGKRQKRALVSGQQALIA